MREAVVVAAVRTAVGRAKTGTLRDTRPEDMLSAVLAEVCQRTPGLKAKDIDDVLIGCARPEAEQGFGMTRAACALAGYPDTVPGQTVSRSCASGLQAIALGAQAVMCGFADTVVAGGVASMSLVPIQGAGFSPHPEILDRSPELYTPAAFAAENVAARFDVSREDMDKFVLRSHERTLKAIEQGVFEDEIVPLHTKTFAVDPKDRSEPEEVVFDTDECPNPRLDGETLAASPPAYKIEGLIREGHCAPHADCAALVVIMSRERAQKLSVEPLGEFRYYSVAGVAPALAGTGSAEAIGRLLRLSKRNLTDFGLVELDEAFASNAVHCIGALDLDDDITNVNGDSIALGNPRGCSGARSAVSLLHEMKRRDVHNGLVAMGIGGGMGIAMLFERL